MANGLTKPDLVGTGNGVSVASSTSTLPLRNDKLKKDTMTHRDGLSYDILTGADTTSAAQVEIDGVTYTKRKIIRNGKEEYIYINAESAKPKSVAEQENLGFWDRWDRKVDGFFDGMLGIDTEATDGKDDGVISAGEKAKYFGRGLISPVKSIAKHPFITAGVAGACIALTAVFPPAGPIIAGIGLLIGLGTAIYGGYKAAKAKTDAEAKGAWENIGSGVITAALSFLGFKKANSAAGAKASVKTKPGVKVPKAKVPTKAPKVTGNAQIDNARSTALNALKTHGKQSTEFKQALANLEKARYDNARSIALNALRTHGKQSPEFGKAWNDCKALHLRSVRATANANKSVANPQTTPVIKPENTFEYESRFDIFKNFKDGAFDKLDVNGNKLSLGDVVKGQLNNAKEAAKYPLFRIKGCNLKTVENLSLDLQNCVARGDHQGAKLALWRMKSITSSLSGDDGVEALKLVDSAKALISSTKWINSPVPISTVNTATTLGGVEVAVDNSIQKGAEEAKKLFVLPEELTEETMVM